MTDLDFMRRALDLADRAAGLTSPNPLVGAVVVRDSVVVGEGFHAGPGRPHAEIEALRAAGDPPGGGSGRRGGGGASPPPPRRPRGPRGGGGGGGRGSRIASSSTVRHACRRRPA